MVRALAVLLALSALSFFDSCVLFLIFYYFRLPLPALQRSICTGVWGVYDRLVFFPSFFFGSSYDTDEARQPRRGGELVRRGEKREIRRGGWGRKFRDETGCGIDVAGHAFIIWQRGAVLSRAIGQPRCEILSSRRAGRGGAGGVDGGGWADGWMLPAADNTEIQIQRRGGGRRWVRYRSQPSLRQRKRGAGGGMCVCLCVCVCVRAREREREREREST